MLFLDRRVGSGHYLETLLQLGTPAELVTLDFADAAFLGHGHEGDHSVSVGIEIKKIHDLISSIDSGRLNGHQLPGLLRQYDAVWLVVEGLWRPSPVDGVLELHKRGKWEALSHGRRTYMFKEVDNFLTTLELKAGLRIRRTASSDETARMIAGLYGWWTNKTWAQHRSHLALHRPDTAMLIPPPLRRRIASELPGIGHERSAEVARHFPNTLQMVNADVKEWTGITGIGKTIARRIVEALGRE